MKNIDTTEANYVINHTYNINLHIFNPFKL